MADNSAIECSCAPMLVPIDRHRGKLSVLLALMDSSWKTFPRPDAQADVLERVHHGVTPYRTSAAAIMCLYRALTLGYLHGGIQTCNLGSS